MPALIEKCTEELAKNVTTTNVINVLQLCDEFQLLKLRSKIMQQLTSNKKALQDVAQSQQILQHPLLLQEMLGLMAQQGEKEAAKEAAQKKLKKQEVAKAKEASGPVAQEVTQEAVQTKRVKQEMSSLTAEEEAQEAAEPQTKRRIVKKK